VPSRADESAPIRLKAAPLTKVSWSAKEFMPFHFAFTTVEVLWTLTFAAQLVLLVVLLGRERIHRYRWFTASIILVALRLLVQRVLYNRLPQLTFNGILIVLADVGAVVGLLVLAELAWRAFQGVRRTTWIAATLAVLAVGAAVLVEWGPWPAWKTLTANSKLAALLLMQLAAQKTDLLVSVLTVELGLLVALFGRRYKAGFRSHTQQIVIGLSTAAIAQMATQAIWQRIAATVIPKTQAEYLQARGLQEKLYNADNVVYLVVLVWWIACLWNDEPGTATATETDAAQAPVVDVLCAPEEGEPAEGPPRSNRDWKNQPLSPVTSTLKEGIRGHCRCNANFPELF